MAVDRLSPMVFRMDPTDRAMLDTLAEDARESVATVLRQLVREAYKAKHGDKKPKLAKPTK